MAHQKEPPPRRRRLVFKHMAGKAIPTDHISFAQALDEIGKHDFKTWGTQRAFAYMPITRSRDRKLVGLELSVTSLGTWNKIVEVELPKGVIGPSAGILSRQFKSVREALKDAISREQIRAQYHKTDAELSALPIGLCTSKARATMMLGITRDDKRRYRPIFIHKYDFDRWLARRGQTQASDGAPVKKLAKDSIPEIAGAINRIAETTKWYPTVPVLKEIIQEAARSAGRDALYSEDIKRIRGELDSEFTDPGVRRKESSDKKSRHRESFIIAIKDVMHKYIAVRTPRLLARE